jgi:excinuclease ABC subunit C
MDSSYLQRLDPPDHPGVYIMRDRTGKIIYVGKALSLRKRLASYFRSPDQLEPKTQALVSKIEAIEMVLTDSEIEALVLECTLIKKHHPRYNILMRDDKSYPYLKLSVQEPFPRLFMTRRPFIDEAKYFGPFTSVNAKEVARQLSMFFRLCLCKKTIKIGERKRPCLNCQLGRCDGACMGALPPEAYAPRVRAILNFLEGREDPVTPVLEHRMLQAAENQHYELAATLRDQLGDLQKVRHQPLVSSPGRENRDIFGLARSGPAATVEIFQVRAGNLEGRRHFFLQHVGASTADEILSQILTQYYSRPVTIPTDVIMPSLPQDAAVVRQWLEARQDEAVELRLPRNSEEERLLKMAETNAWLYLKHSVSESTRELSDENRKTLADLASRLKLSSLPLRVECYDISNISGQDAVGSQVVFTNGEPDKMAYRHYRIKTVIGSNDFAMLQEVLDRRLRRINEHAAGPAGATPDLIVVDGGAGQLSSGLAVLRELNLSHIPMIGLAKREEEIYLPGLSEPLRLAKASRALHFLIQLRDEAHRFAINYHRKLRGRRMRLSELDKIEGLGPAKRRLILRTFGSVEALLQVQEEELAGLPGIGPVLARKIREFLGRPL